jgi:hypothetical protein
MSLADFGFNDAGLDAGFEDCGARTVGGKPAFHDPTGRPLVDGQKFPSGLANLVKYGHARNLTVSWYGNACACKSENSYTENTQPTIAQAVAGTVAATVDYGFDGLKLDSCSQFNNMTLWAMEINATGKKILLENCHQGGLVPGQVMPGQNCTGTTEVSDCPYHVFRSSDDIYNKWENVVNNINSVSPYLSQADPAVVPRSRPGGWAYPDMLEVGNLGCPTGKSCNQTTPPIDDRTQFGMWAIVSSPLVLSVDLTNRAMLERVWPILSNIEAISVNQHWSGSPGQLLLTDKTTFPSPLSANGYYEYPGKLGQSRGWQNVPGMIGPAPWQVGITWVLVQCMAWCKGVYSLLQCTAWCKCVWVGAVHGLMWNVLLTTEQWNGVYCVWCHFSQHLYVHCIALHRLLMMLILNTFPLVSGCRSANVSMSTLEGHAPTTI